MFKSERPFVLLFAVYAALSKAAPATDAAPHFEMQESGVTANLRGISAVSDAIVWASGENGTIVRTLDGGEHWEKVFLSIYIRLSRDVDDVQAANSRNLGSLLFTAPENVSIFV